LPSALAAILNRLEILLDDESNALWTEAQLTEHVTNALRDLSQYVPQEKKGTVATAADSRAVDISALTERVGIVAVEYPIDLWPRQLVRFDVWIDVLTIINDPVPNGDNCYVFYHALHTINGTDTLPEQHEFTLLLLAAALACEQQIADAINTLATGGDVVPGDWSSLARNFRLRYQERVDPLKGIQTSRMYAPTAPIPAQNTDPGP